MKTAAQARRATALAKYCVIRHGHGTRRSCNAEEKSIETAVRQAGKAECQAREEQPHEEQRMVYHFQNPNSGTPMYLTARDGIHVEIDEPEGFTPHATDFTDMYRLTRAVRRCTDIHEAAKILFKDFDCKDILS